MNQQANNIKQQAEVLTKNLNDLVGSVDAMINDSFKNISPDMAIQYAEALKSAKVDSKINETRSELENLKNIFK